MAKKDTYNRIDKTNINKKVGDKYFLKLTQEANNIYNFMMYQLRQIFFFTGKGKIEDIKEETLEIVKAINEHIENFNIESGKNEKVITLESSLESYLNQGKLAMFNSIIRDRDVESFPDKKNPYKEIQSGIAQGVIKDSLFHDWKAYYATLSAYYKNKSKFKGYPKPPGYKKKGGQMTTIIPSNAFADKDGIVTIAKKSIGYTFKKSRPKDKLTQIRIKPMRDHYVLEQVYQYEENEEINDKLKNISVRCIGVDLGIDNIMAVANNFNDKTFIVNGKVIKSINQHWNKQRAKAMSYIGNKGYSNRLNKLDYKRNNRINDHIHKASRHIVDYCLDNNVDTIIIGYNQGWKQKSDMGKINNQKFTNIPHKKLIDKITYKANEIGIKVVLNEESYTSKCDALGLEDLKYHDTYMGKREKRGMFISNSGQMINADINGALNILRKVIGDDFIRTLNISNLTPTRINVV